MILRPSACITRRLVEHSVLVCAIMEAQSSATVSGSKPVFSQSANQAAQRSMKLGWTRARSGSRKVSMARRRTRRMEQMQPSGPSSSSSRSSRLPAIRMIGVSAQMTKTSFPMSTSMTQLRTLRPSTRATQLQSLVPRGWP